LSNPKDSSLIETESKKKRASKKRTVNVKIQCAPKKIARCVNLGAVLTKAVAKLLKVEAKEEENKLLKDRKLSE
jgi:ribosomal protein S16